MSIILQIGASHLPSGVPVSCCDNMGAGSEPDTMEAPIAPEDCGITQPVTTTYANCFGLPYQDHNYGAPPPPTPPQSPGNVNGTIDEDTSTSVVTTSTTNEDEAVEEESITRCICEFDHDDEYMICCDKCSVWQHVDCMGLDRDNIPETYMCEKCEPRKVDRQKAKALQTKKREELTADSSSEDSGDENAQYKPVAPPSTVAGKGKKVKRQKREKVVEEKVPASPSKKVKRGREKSEPRRTQLRKQRKSKSADMNHIDEDARDSWDSSASDWREKYEEAENNQYSPEVHLQLGNRKLNGHRDETTKKVLKYLHVQLCRVADVTKESKGLVAIEDVEENQIICEYRGKFLLVSQFQQQNPVFNDRLHPYVLFYSFHKDQEDVCVDSREYGNDARFIRRSCTPNAEVRHVVENGSLHLYIFSCQEIKHDEEVTIPFDFDYQNCIDTVECACQNPTCPVASQFKRNGMIIENSGQEKKANKKIKKVLTANDDSSQSSAAGSATPVSVTKVSPLRMTQTSTQPMAESINDEGNEEAEEETSPSAVSGGAAGSAGTPSEDTEADEQSSDRRRKMTREERKMEAIMKAFARLEKAQQRRQEALARLAHKKEEQEQKKKEEEEKKKDVEQASPEEVKTEQQTEDSAVTIPSENPPSSDEGKAPLAKPKGKGKKRKNSGTPARRRSRMNSGGSDILSPDESTQGTINTTASTPPIPSPQMIIEASIPTPNTPSNNGFKFPKTKKLLMSEWFSEKPEPVSQPLTIKTEPADFTTASPTCYMRCARSPTGISTAHLRRSSSGSGSSQVRQTSDSSMGSAKKRWLRQAMCEEVVTGGQGSPIPNGSMSPTQCAGSPSTSPPAAPDLVTPLKKRRLARESMSSDTLPSTPPHTPSPSVGGQSDSTLVDCPSTSCDLDDEDSHLLNELNELQANFNTELELSELKASIRDDLMYEKAVAFLQTVPQDSSSAKSLESLQDYFKKGTKVTVDAPNVVSTEVTPCTSVEEATREIVFNTDVAMESQEHLDQVQPETEKRAQVPTCSLKDVAPVENSNNKETLNIENNVPTSSCKADCMAVVEDEAKAFTCSDVKEAVGECSVNYCGSIDEPLVPEKAIELDETVLLNDKGTVIAKATMDETVFSSGTTGTVIATTTVDEAVLLSGTGIAKATMDDTVLSSGNGTVVEKTAMDETALSIGKDAVIAEEVITLENSNESEETDQVESSSVMTADSSTDDQVDGTTMAVTVTEAVVAVVAEALSSFPVPSATTSKDTANEEEPVIDVLIVESSAQVVAPKPDSSVSSETSSLACLSQSTNAHPTITCVEDRNVTENTSGSLSPNNIISSSVAAVPLCSSSVSSVSEATLTELDVSNSQITSTSSSSNNCVVSQSSSASSSPLTASSHNQTTKRKVSLLEYRKRKLESRCSSRSSVVCTSSSSSSSSSSYTARGAEQDRQLAVSSTSIASPNPADPLRELSTPPRLSTLPLFDSTSPTDVQKSQTKDGKKAHEDDVRWNSAPTAVEQQRENLTQRLRREFGLITDEDSDSEKDRPEPLEADGFARTQNGRLIGCYPSHPPATQPLVRAGVPTAVTRNIPTIIGITGYQPPPRPPPIPPPTGPPVAQNSISTTSQQQYGYQHYGSHPATFSPQPPQGGQPPTQFPELRGAQKTRVVPQYSGGQTPAQPHTTMLRPPVATHGPPQGPCTGIPAAVAGPSGSQSTTYMEQHVTPQPVLRPSRPPLLQTYSDPQQQHHYSAPTQQTHQPGFYPQGYYQ